MDSVQFGTYFVLCCQELKHIYNRPSAQQIVPRVHYNKGMTIKGSNCWPPVCNPNENNVPPRNLKENLIEFSNSNGKHPEIHYIHHKLSHKN